MASESEPPASPQALELWKELQSVRPDGAE